MDVDPVTSARWRYAGGGALLALFGWYAFVRGVRVPLLGWIDLFVHEAGHVLALPLPDLGEAVMGSGLQVLMPLAFAVAFLWQQRDWLGSVVCLGWLATSLQDASVYIADAPFERLPLIGGMHDWAWILGSTGNLDHAAGIARVVWTLGLCVWLLAVAGCAAGPRLERLVRAGLWPRWPLAPLPRLEDDARAASRPDRPVPAPQPETADDGPDGGFFTTPR